MAVQRVPKLSWAAVCARRLARHALDAPLSGARPEEIVGAICGAHAQVLTAAEWSIGLRGEGIDRAAIREALWGDHRLIKTYGPRGTVHLLPASDLARWTGAFCALPSASPFPEGVRLSPEQTDAVVAAIGEALRDAELTVDELTAEIVARAGAWAGDLVMPAFQGFWPRWRQAMGTAAHRGALCFGPNRGRKVTYTNPRRWLPGFRPDEGPAASAWLLRRYLYAYGPATPQHFAQWLATSRGWAAALFDALAGELEEVEVEGDRAWVLAGDTAAPEAAPQGVRLLPHFDAYAVGCQPRAKLFPGRAMERATARGQAGNFPVMLADGIVGGVWHQRRAGRHVDITVEPLAPLTAAQRRDLDEQATRVAAFLGGTPRLTIGTVSVGAHA